MEPTTVTLSSQGQISIPVSMRELLGLKAKDRLEVSFDRFSGRLTIARQETLEEALARINSDLPSETRAAIKKNAGKTASQLRYEYMTSPEGRAAIKEKYFNAN